MSEVVYLTAAQVAEKMGCTRQHVYNLMSSGALPCSEIGRPGAKHKTKRVREDVLEKWLNRGQTDRRRR